MVRQAHHDRFCPLGLSHFYKLRTGLSKAHRTIILGKGYKRT